MGMRVSATHGACLAAGPDEVTMGCNLDLWVFTWQVEDVHDTLAVAYSPPLDLILSADTFIYVQTHIHIQVMSLMCMTANEKADPPCNLWTQVTAPTTV
jgi:hypothetical protein